MAAKPILLAAALAFAAYGVRGLSAPLGAVPAPGIQIHQSLARRAVTTDAQGQTHETWQPLADAAPVQPGDILRVTQRVENRSSQPIKNFVLTQPIAPGLEYQPLSASVTGGDGVQITFQAGGAAGYSALPMAAVPLPDGTVKRVPVSASAYRAVRWTWMQSIPVGASAEAVCLEKVR